MFLEEQQMVDKYVILKAYDGKIVRVPFDKKDEYLRTQEIIKFYIQKGKSLKEIIELLGDKNEN